MSAHAPADAAPLQNASERTAADVLAWSLRMFGGIDLLALVPFLMPLEWIRVGHEFCGFGPFPAEPIAEYLARATSLLWAMHGALLLFLARDVRRRVEVIRFVALITVLVSLGLFGLSWRAGMPMWWLLLEGPVFAATGLWYLWWLRKLEQAPQP